MKKKKNQLAGVGTKKVLSKKVSSKKVSSKKVSSKKKDEKEIYTISVAGEDIEVELELERLEQAEVQRTNVHFNIFH